MAVVAERAELEVSPTLDEVRELAREHSLIPVRHVFIDDCETPVAAYLKLRGSGPSFLLESAEQGQRFGRWSFIGAQQRAVMRLEHGRLTVDGEPREHVDPYAAVADEIGRYRLAPTEGLPPFAGGAVGMFGYDLVRTFEPSVGPRRPDELGVPDLAVMVSHVLVAFDHFTHTVTVLAYVFADEGDLELSYVRAVDAIADVRERLAAPVPRADAGRREPPEWTSNIGSEGYAAAVEVAKEHIRAGDAYQIVPSQRWSADCPVDAFSIYRGIRTINPSPYMYFLEFGDFQIAGASPEPLVKVTGRRAETRPIAGTYPRGTSEDEDRRQAVGAMDALRAVLPAGTLSGAPKVRAMQIIDELEPHKRGSYGGAIGYLGFGGDLDTAIHIRTVVVKDGLVHVQAGGGTVADARPDYEFAESVSKAKAVFAAV